MATNLPHKPVLEQAQVSIAKKRPKSCNSFELCQRGRRIAKRLLAKKGLTFLDPHLPAIATQLNYPEIARQLVQEQGEDIQCWTQFAPGLSQSTVIRFLTGQAVSAPAYYALCVGIAVLGNIRFDPEEMAAPDPKPYFQQLYRVNQKRIVALAQGKRFGYSILDREWAKKPSVVVPTDSLFIEPTSQLAPIYKIYAHVRTSIHQVGVIVASPTDELKFLVDGRLYLWTGVEVKNGRKIIRTLRIDGDVKAHVLSLLCR